MLVDVSGLSSGSRIAWKSFGVDGAEFDAGESGAVNTLALSDSESIPSSKKPSELGETGEGYDSATFDSFEHVSSVTAMLGPPDFVPLVTARECEAAPISEGSRSPTGSRGAALKLIKMNPESVT